MLSNANFGWGRTTTCSAFYIQPVIPFRLTDEWNLISRTVAPVIYQPELAPGVGETFGLGDIQLSLFLSPAKPGALIWGAGVILQFPTATDDVVDQGKWGAGPTVAALTIQGPWVIGALINNVWSFAGDGDRKAVNQMLLQPIVNHNLPGGWFLNSVPYITADWKADGSDRWTVPIRRMLGDLTQIVALCYPPAKLAIRTHAGQGWEASIGMSTSTAPTPSSPPSIPVRVRFDRFELDEANATLIRDGKAVALAPTPFAVLCALVRQPGSLLTKHALLDQVWGRRFVSDSVLKTAISDLRAALDDDARHPRLIETVSRRGYRFIAATTAIRASSPAGTTGAPHRSLQSPTFIGRAEALSRLRSAWDTACSGRRAVVWVAGEPDIGKTMLIEHFVAGLGDFACARGQCVEHYGTGEPYLPVLEALAELCRSDTRFRPCCAPWPRPGCCSCRGSAPPRSATGCDESSPASARSHAAGDGRAARPLHGESSFAAHHGGLALERSRDRAAHGLHRPPPRPFSTAVARQLPPYGDHRRGPSAPGRCATSFAFMG